MILIGISIFIFILLRAIVIAIPLLVADIALTIADPRIRLS